jgi:drug/metabolite transporter (DMT)-like permease
MFYLISAIILSTAIVVLFKLFERFKINITQAIVTNYLVASGLGFLLSENFIFQEIPGKEWFIYAIITGVTLILAFNVFAVSAQKAGVAVTSVSGKMSVIIPITIGILLYKEPVSLVKISGIVAALIAFYLTFQKGKNKNKADNKYYFLPVLLFLGNGLNDSMLKHSERNFIHGDTLVFLSTAFLFSFIIGMIILAVSVIAKKKKILFKNIFAGIILGLLNWGSTLYFIKGLGIFESTFFFPVFNVSIVAFSAIIGYFIFKEKLSPVNWAGIILAAVSIILITFATAN